MNRYVRTRPYFRSVPELMIQMDHGNLLFVRDDIMYFYRKEGIGYCSTAKGSTHRLITSFENLCQDEFVSGYFIELRDHLINPKHVVKLFQMDGCIEFILKNGVNLIYSKEKIDINHIIELILK